MGRSVRRSVCVYMMTHHHLHASYTSIRTCRQDVLMPAHLIGCSCRCMCSSSSSSSCCNV